MKSSKIVLFLLAALIAARPIQADTNRTQAVVTQLGIDEKTESAETREAAAAVDRLVALGLKSYPTIRARDAQLQSARASVDAAQGSYQPHVGLDGYVDRTRSRDLKQDLNVDLETQTGRVFLRENLWRGGQDSGLVDIARQNEELALLRQLNEQEYLSFSIRKAALDYNYRTLRQVIDEASAMDASDLRALAERKFGAGQVGKIDLHLSSMRESQAKASAARDSVQAQQAYQNLLGLLGPGTLNAAVEQDIQSLTKRALPFPAEAPVLTDEKKATLNERNSLALQKRADITLDQNYRGRFLPSIDFIGSWGRTNGSKWLVENDDQKVFNKTQDTSLQLQFSWAIWDRTQDYQIRAAAADKTAATADLDASRYEAETEARRLQAYVSDLHKTLAISREAYVQAGQLYDAQRKLYDSGVIGMQPLIDAERDKKSAISAWQENVYELQLSLLRWQALQRGFLVSGSLESGS